MEPGSSSESLYLSRLAEELRRSGFTARLDQAAAPVSLQVANPDSAELSDRVGCRAGRDQAWSFWWSWGQPIGPAEDPAGAAAAIVSVLRSVEGTP